MNYYKMKSNQKSPSNGINIKLSNIDKKTLKSAKMAVRYGYSYRKIAQLHCHNSNHSLNYCLPEVNEFLLWLGSVVLSGLAWDGIKSAAKKMYNLSREQIHKSNDEETLLVFTNEAELNKFYSYIKEFQDGLSYIDDAEYRYIEEEMMADFCAEMETEIVMREKRLITIEERIQIYKAALLKIQSIVKRKIL